MKEEIWLEVSVAARKLGVSESTIYRHKNAENSPLVIRSFGLKKCYRVAYSSIKALQGTVCDNDDYVA